MAPNMGSPVNDSLEGRKFRVAVIEVKGGFSNQDGNGNENATKQQI